MQQVATAVPTTLAEAHRELERRLSQEELAKVDAMQSEFPMSRLQLYLDDRLVQDWVLWAEGPLTRHMKDLGISRPGDMADAILKTFWCSRHQQDFRLQERAAYYAVLWKSYADPPKTARDPADGSEIAWGMARGTDEEWVPWRIYCGQSKKTGRWLAYEHDKGVYVPDAALMKHINEQEASRKDSPFGN